MSRRPRIKRSQLLWGFSPVLFERLEPRCLFAAINPDPNGFSQFDSSGKTIVYVSSSSGSDSNDGLSQGLPVQSISKAKGMVNSGQADWMMLRRGDVFPAIGIWTRSGPSASDPLVIGAYGNVSAGQDPRAVIHSGTGDGFVTMGNGGAVNNFAIVGLHFYADGYNGVNAAPTGIRLLKQGSGILVEDTMVEGYKDNIVLQGDGSAINGFTVRRSVVVDAYAASGAVGHAQGIYVSGSSSNVLIEENVFDHNGWKEGVAAPTVFNHDMYINTGAQGVVITKNIVSRASENGILLRAGGTVTNNLIIRSSVGAIVSNTSSVMSGNVVLEGIDLPDLAQGIGLNSVNLPSLNIANNIIAHDTSDFTSNVTAIAMQWGIGSGGVNGNIVFDWRNGISSGGASVGVGTNQIQSYDTTHTLINQRDSGPYTYHDNIYSSPMAAPFRQLSSSMSFAQWQSSAEPTAQNIMLNYLDPWRDVGTYGAQFASTDGTFDGWINAARGLSKLTWNAALTAGPAAQWIRDGFEVLDPNDPRGSNFRTIVNIVASDASAKEPTSDGNGGYNNDVNKGKYTVSRTGPIDQQLVVKLGVPTGSAEAGVDYNIDQKLSVTFQPGQRTADINLTPFGDEETEGKETATLTIIPFTGYEIGPRKSATVVIADRSDTISGGGGTGGGGGGTGGGGTPTGGGGEGGGAVGQPPITGDGLFGQYYSDANLTTLDFTRHDYIIDMDFGT
ncbi:MAG TPA: right-handed parallel beta-helix repeat-containing protein, partial [Tepidisphaeraceae bacterium]|nr:right-handed parallel beta-helix repeat-containing protein [Tepidisphaeraceae bacterium]